MHTGKEARATVHRSFTFQADIWILLILVVATLFALWWF